MSSGFVSGGSLEKPVERDDEWLKAQLELEETRRQKAEQERLQGGKSLYEVLQENKAKKQEAFEESIKLKNQFRSLDEDEVNFLDSILESERAKEAAIRQETSKGLSQFRKQQEQAEKASIEPTDTRAIAAEEQEAWAVSGKKRKKGREGSAFKGLKVRRTSGSVPESSKGDETSAKATQQPNTSESSTPAVETTVASSTEDSRKTILNSSIAPSHSPPKNGSPGPTSPHPNPPTTLLGLGGYSSDDE